MQETENSIIGDLNELGDILDRSEFLVRLGKQYQGMPEREKSNDNLIKDCQTTTWLKVEWEETSEGLQLIMKADSQSLLVKGALALIDEIYNGRTKKEADSFKCRLIEEKCFMGLFSDRQRLGIKSIISKLS